MEQVKENNNNKYIHAISLDIPDTDYPTTIKMSSSEFVSLYSLSNCIKIEVKEEKVLSWLQVRLEVENML